MLLAFRASRPRREKAYRAREWAKRSLARKSNIAWGKSHQVAHWVLMGGLHRSRSDPIPHYTVRGFSRDGTGLLTLHVYSESEDVPFNNGGKKWTTEGRKLKLDAECVPI